jgi:hypothetical protein
MQRNQWQELPSGVEVRKPLHVSYGLPGAALGHAGSAAPVGRAGAGGSGRRSDTTRRSAPRELREVRVHE